MRAWYGFAVRTDIAAIYDPTIISLLTEADGIPVPKRNTFMGGLALKAGICFFPILDAK